MGDLTAWSKGETMVVGLGEPGTPEWRQTKAEGGVKPSASYCHETSTTGHAVFMIVFCGGLSLFLELVFVPFYLGTEPQPSVLDSVFIWSFRMIWHSLAAFMAFGSLWSLPSGGKWRCSIANGILSWSQPRARFWRSGEDHCILVARIREFVIDYHILDDGPGWYSYFVVTDEDEVEIDHRCFGKYQDLVRALVESSPSIRVRFRKLGHIELAGKHVERMAQRLEQELGTVITVTEDRGGNDCDLPGQSRR